MGRGGETLVGVSEFAPRANDADSAGVVEKALGRVIGGGGFLALDGADVVSSGREP